MGFPIIIHQKKNSMQEIHILYNKIQKKIYILFQNSLLKENVFFGLSRTFAECPRQTIWSHFQPTKSKRKHELGSSETNIMKKCKNITYLSQFFYSETGEL